MSGKKKCVEVHWSSGEVEWIPASELRITSVGSDIIVFLGKIGRPLDISEENRITFSFLYKFLVHPWIYLEEYDTDEGCGNCDGYSYANCDMNRCKNDCEHCGGRRYICNNSCFYHRYDYAFEIKYNDEYLKDIDKVRPFVHQIIKPFCPNWSEIYEENKSEISRVITSCENLFYTSDDIPDVAKDFLEDCSAMHLLMKCRVDDSPTITIEYQNPSRNEKKTFFRRDVAARTTHGGFMWLFKTGTCLEANGYNSAGDVMDCCELYLKKSETYPNLVGIIYTKKLRHVVVNRKDGEYKYDVISISEDK